MTSKQTPWSFSKLSAFELCPKKFGHEQIIRDVPDKPNAMADYGTEAHKAFELRLLKDKRLPLDLRHHEARLAKFAAVPGEKLPEQKLAVNAQFQPTGFFDSDVWCRGIVDFGVITGDRVLFVDWKFGRLKDGFDQLDLMMLLMSAAVPEADRFKGMFYWAKEKVIAPKDYTRADIPDLFLHK